MRADIESRGRRSIAGAIALLAMTLGQANRPAFAADADAPPAPPPNIVLIISDDQAWTDYGFTGHPVIRTPRLDQLAAQSLTFTRGYVTTSLCRPSLATIITGLYPHQHGIIGNDPAPPTDVARPVRRTSPQYLALNEQLIRRIEQVPTLPRLLAPHGYVSHQSGKWWEGTPARGAFTAGMTHGDPARGGRHGDEGLTIARQGFKPVFEFIDAAVAERKPFFIWYAPFLPHQPHNPPPRLLDLYTAPDRPIELARYYAMCHWFDETCGQLLDYLDEKKLADNTLVVYVTDNGWIQRTPQSQLPAGWNQPFAPRSKRSPNEGGIRTPIMLRWPGRITAKRDDDTLVSSIDLAPTLLAAAGIKPTADMPGVNILDADALAKRHRLFGEIFDHDVADLNNPLASLQYRWCIEGRWKLILPHAPNVPGGVELYDLAADPHESRNLAAVHADRARDLTDRINQWWP